MESRPNSPRNIHSPFPSLAASPATRTLLRTMTLEPGRCCAPSSRVSPEPQRGSLCPSLLYPSANSQGRSLIGPTWVTWSLVWGGAGFPGHMGGAEESRSPEQAGRPGRREQWLSPSGQQGAREPGARGGSPGKQLGGSRSSPERRRARRARGLRETDRIATMSSPNFQL